MSDSIIRRPYSGVCPICRHDARDCDRSLQALPVLAFIVGVNAGSDKVVDLENPAFYNYLKKDLASQGFRVDFTMEDMKQLIKILENSRLLSRGKPRVDIHDVIGI